MKYKYIIEENIFQNAIGAAIDFGRAKARQGGATDEELSEYQEKRRACLDHWMPEDAVILTHDRYDKLLAVVETARQMVETVDKVLELTDACIIVNISGKEFHFDATKELKIKLAALYENSPPLPLSTKPD